MSIVTPAYIQVEDDIRAILRKPGYDNGNIGPVLVRLAWHSAGTFSGLDGSGGSNGATMRFAPESTDPANAGLDIARAFLEPIKQKHPWISYADLWTLAGVVSLRHWADLAGQVESGCPVRSRVPPNGRLPDAALDATHLRAIFGRMGFTDRDIVALSGAHALGMCHTDRSGYDGVWTHYPNQFSNLLYKNLLEMTWVKRDWDDWDGPEQYMNVGDEQLMMLPTDMALIWDPEFKKYVEEYAANQDVFFKDFSCAFGRLLELGVTRDENIEGHEEGPRGAPQNEHQDAIQTVSIWENAKIFFRRIASIVFFC
ncbi:heme peroxidase [Rhizoclosmatium globosum]|uniref:Peroxidase n=1 Tax=Rhizoclosmatium globosum TaxID=329046 RepID=A0A1Y2B133_9FUNG|nr:heme peroxidase [Rhizoclosmatium globosum]|eukprot:ORY28446.1 heme peroxidase [Rhizoclosmatium globosum]